MYKDKLFPAFTNTDFIESYSINLPKPFWVMRSTKNKDPNDG